MGCEFTMSSIIIDFWREHPSFWITLPSKQKEVDEIISSKFWNYSWNDENLIGQIIYLDQFSRHFNRLGLIEECQVTSMRIIATNKVKDNIELLRYFDEVEILFALMPFKHLKQYNFIFEYLNQIWLTGRTLDDLPKLQKFYIDTYSKAFTFETILTNIVTNHKLEPYDSALICDYYPERYLKSEWVESLNFHGKIVDYLNQFDTCFVSLSGGVDSMVILAVLKSLGKDVSAIHIIYGNRKESEHEYRFLTEYCHHIGVKLFVYRIEWLRRGTIDRTFYEDMTRKIRFDVYRACVSEKEDIPVILGHIRDDVVENIWTNIAHCHHLGNLKKMTVNEIQNGVKITRPLLECEKSIIYSASQQNAIPYLKNTTPSWSNRGKFREHFHEATVAQFGESIDSKVIEFAEAIQKQAELLNKLLYDPIYESFADNKVNITNAVKAQIDANCWVGIFERLCHKNLGISRPSIKAIRDFTFRLYKSWDTLNVEMGKHLKIKVSKTKDSQYIMELIL